ncbi:MAG: GNAT family N-acetyltransferase [Candidatus Azobacteroides sp.]|nr:GNAT family N-acetyltransferase [Candidatus Azobacteroides sp.]
MEEIIAPVNREILKAELTPDKFLRKTNKGGNEIYIITARNSPNLMREIGRLREIAFRSAGGGTGKAVDIDEFDTMEDPYRQLFVWNPESEDILGGYRYIPGDYVKMKENNQPNLASGHMFRFSDKFVKEYLPRSIELGRSFVNLEYQSTRFGSKGIFALDNLWDGLGALTVVKPNVEYFFGKVTMYPDYNSAARNMIFYFLNKHFPDPDQLVVPYKPLNINPEVEYLSTLFTNESFKEDYKILNHKIREFGLNIPPLINAYMSLSPTMKVFGTAINDIFGDVEETGILIALNEILDEKKQRHIETYLKDEGLSL